MLFSSPEYIFLFLPLIVIGYFVLNRWRLTIAGKAWLVVASLFFYGYWNPEYLLLIMSSMVVNFGLGSALRQAGVGGETPNTFAKKVILGVGIAFNLGLLGYYKYRDFLIENVNLLAETEIPLLDLLLPLGISFFTFQQISYLVDSYRSETQEYDFLNYCLFVSFFPQLIAGPIVHHGEMMPQFHNIRKKLVNWKNISVGCFIFAIGLFKKVAVADTFAGWADGGFAAREALTFLEAWGTSLSYTFQLYYDFSGYTDMAIGAALMFNIHLPINFESPYRSVSIKDFWRRWHMTLSRWLRDYVYIPLGGNRLGNTRSLGNLFLTFLLGGLWHGAGWTFVLWGALHGLALAAHRIWNGTRKALPVWLGWLMTFLFVNCTWVIFRAEDLETARRLLKSMLNIKTAQFSMMFLDQASAISHLSWYSIFSGYGHRPAISEWSLFASAVALISVLCFPNSMDMKNKLLRDVSYLTIPKLIFISIVTGVSLALLYTSSSKVFLYFNF